MKDNARRRFRRIPLRKCSLAVAFCGVAFLALKSPSGVWWTVLSSFALLAILAAAVVAVLERGPRQAFALGFVVCAGLYGVILVLAPRTNSAGWNNFELDPHSGVYPTTKLLTPVFEAFVVRKWYDLQTEREILNYDPALVSATASMRESIDRSDFMAVGHLLWALLLGFLGGCFGRHLYRTRLVGEPSSPIYASASIG